VSARARPGEVENPGGTHDPLGRVYTPTLLARAIVAAVEGDPPTTVLDPGFGGGALLDAARWRWPAVTTLGVDRDPEAPGRTSCSSYMYADWPTVWRFWDRFALRSMCPSAGAVPDLILMNPPFGDDVGIDVPILHVSCALDLSRRVVAILPLPYVGSKLFDRVWKARRPAILHRLTYRPFPNLRECCALQWVDGPVSETVVRDLVVP
jgi:predicted RNA methylase